MEIEIQFPVGSSPSCLERVYWGMSRERSMQAMTSSEGWRQLEDAGYKPLRFPVYLGKLETDLHIDIRYAPSSPSCMVPFSARLYDVNGDLVASTTVTASQVNVFGNLATFAIEPGPIP